MDTIDRIFAFGKEINTSKADYNKFKDMLNDLSKNHFPLSPEMDGQQKKIMVASRAKALLDQNVLQYEFAMDVLNLIQRSDEATIDEYTCF